MKAARLKIDTIFLYIIFPLMLIYSNILGAAIIADHGCIPQFSQVPASVINQVQDNYRLFYGHTSHGSQIVTGMGMLRDGNILYDFNNGAGTLIMQEFGSDLGTSTGDPPAWVTYTQNHLDEPGCQTNMVMWSWCGGVSIATVDDINNYLAQMSQLELDHPGVTFIYMTGHLDGTGPTGNLYLRNNQIRDYCVVNEKILFDFADIESYNPDGTYFPDEMDACNWCYDWCAAHVCDMCPADCAHSHCLNCYLKGKAFWWMLATIIGWNPISITCGDANSDGNIDILDIVFLINYRYKSGPAPNPIEYGDVNNDANVNILDIVYLINYKYKLGPEPDCPEI